MTPDQATAARSRPGALASALLEASISVLTDGERAALDGCTGLDATPVPLFSRGPSKRTGLHASDPDGGWYVREGDHREREDDKGKPLRKLAWALEATIATTARPPGAELTCPNLAIGMAMTRPGEDPAAPAHGCWPPPPPAGTQPAGSATTAPTPKPSPNGSTCPHGHSATHRSWTTGSTSSASKPTAKVLSALPEPLITATAGLRDHAIDRDGRPDRRPRSLLAETQRRPRRRRIPAAVLPRPRRPPRADMRAARTSLSPRDGRAKVLQPPHDPPKLCRQTAITIAPDIGARYRQDLPNAAQSLTALLLTAANIRKIQPHNMAGNTAEPRYRPLTAALSDPAATLEEGHRHSSVGTTPAVLSVTRESVSGI